MNRCDCLNACGDDPAVKNGRTDPCARYLWWLSLARIVAVTRDNGNERCALTVYYSAQPTEDDIHALQNFDRWPSP